jgi:hypothetical protein
MLYIRTQYRALLRYKNFLFYIGTQPWTVLGDWS